MNAQNSMVVTERVGDVFGKVVSVIPGDNLSDEAVINRGKLDGISASDQFLIYEMGEELFDPDTHESLGKLEIVKGIAKPKHIQDKITTLTSAEYQPPVKRRIKSNHPHLYHYVYHFGEEEIVESPPEPIPFRNVKVGDLVKPMKKKIGKT